MDDGRRTTGSGATAGLTNFPSCGYFPSTPPIGIGASRNPLYSRKPSARHAIACRGFHRPGDLKRQNPHIWLIFIYHVKQIFTENLLPILNEFPALSFLSGA
jgi:hypothetical protein